MPQAAGRQGCRPAADMGSSIRVGGGQVRASSSRRGWIGRSGLQASWPVSGARHDKAALQGSRECSREGQHAQHAPTQGRHKGPEGAVQQLLQRGGGACSSMASYECLQPVLALAPVHARAGDHNATRPTRPHAPMPGLRASSGPYTVAGQMATRRQRSCWPAMDQACISATALALHGRCLMQGSV